MVVRERFVAKAFERSLNDVAYKAKALTRRKRKVKIVVWITVLFCSSVILIGRMVSVSRDNRREQKGGEDV